jgi:hypothetical protein
VRWAGEGAVAVLSRPLIEVVEMRGWGLRRPRGMMDLPEPYLLKFLDARPHRMTSRVLLQYGAPAIVRQDI